MLYKKYLFALLKKYKWFYLAMVLVATLATALLLGSYSACTGFSNAYDDYLEKYGYTDIIINTEIAKYEDLKKVEDTLGVDSINVRAAINYTLKAENDLLTIRLITVPKDAIIGVYTIDECEKNSDYPNVYIERKFADNNNIKVGDIVNIQFTDEYKECYVEKIVQSTETTFFKITPFMTSNYIDSGCVYMGEDDYYDILAESPFYQGKYANEVIVSVNDDYNIESVKNDCVALLEDEDIKVSTSEFGDNILYANVMNNYLSTIKKTAILVPIVFYLIMLIVSLLFLIQIVKSSYKDIGILMMIGYKKGQIISLYSLCSLLVSIFSIGLGVTFGFKVLDYVSYLLVREHLFPYTFADMDINLIIVAIVTTVLVGQLACLLSSLKLRSVTPISVWADEKDVRSQKSGGKLQNSLPIPLVLAINSHKRNPQGFFASTFAFFAAYLLIFVGLSINNAVDANVNQMLDKRLDYDAQVILIDDVDEDTYKKFCNDENTLYSEKAGVGTVTIEANGISESNNFEVLSVSHKYWKVFDKKDKDELEIPKDGIILDYTVAERLGVTKGDTVTLNGKEVKVAELSAMYTRKFIVISFEMADKLELDYLDSYIVNINEHENLLTFLSDEKITAYTLFSDNLGKTIESESISFKLLTRLLIIFAILIGFTVVCIVNISSFNEQKRRISIMRVLGNRVIDISNVWLLQFLISFAISLVFAVPFAYEFAKRFLEFISGKVYTYPFINEPRVYFMTIGFILAFYAVAHIITIQTVRRFNLADNTRSRE